jgi:hypothetical protein
LGLGVWGLDLGFRYRRQQGPWRRPCAPCSACLASPAATNSYQPLRAVARAMCCPGMVCGGCAQRLRQPFMEHLSAVTSSYMCHVLLINARYDLELLFPTSPHLRVGEDCNDEQLQPLLAVTCMTWSSFSQRARISGLERIATTSFAPNKGGTE